MSSKVGNITSIKCYAPTELGDDNEKNEFYSRLSAVYGSTSHGDIVIVMCDLNAKVVVGTSGAEYVVAMSEMITAAVLWISAAPNIWILAELHSSTVRMIKCPGSTLLVISRI